MKPELKKKAIKLRKKGQTYSEILTQVPVAKSTLSLWLRDVGLAKRQKQRITRKKLASARRGGERKRQIRIERTAKIYNAAKKDIGLLNNRDLFLLGIALYWAEGAKEKKHRTNTRLRFGNSDIRMIQLYLKWLLDIVLVDPSDITFALYIHENHRHREQKVKKYWSIKTAFPLSTFVYTYYKKHNPKTQRKNTGKEYYGLLDITVRKSSDLTRKVEGWVQGIMKNLDK